MRNFLYRLYRTRLEVHHLLPIEKVREFSIFTSSHPEVFLRKGVLSAIIEIALRHGCSAVNLLHIFRIAFPKKISGWQLLYLKPCQTSKIFFSRQKAERFCRKPPIIFEKSCILNPWRSSGTTLELAKSQIIGLFTSSY